MAITTELLTSFVNMDGKEWRALTVSMGVMYRVRLDRETYIVDSVRKVFGDDVPAQREWEKIKRTVNAVRRQVRRQKQKDDFMQGVTTNDSPYARKRAYQRDYMRRRRATAKANVAPREGAD
jgi:hypothetical protein